SSRNQAPSEQPSTLLPDLSARRSEPKVHQVHAELRAEERLLHALLLKHPLMLRELERLLIPALHEVRDRTRLGAVQLPEPRTRHNAVPRSAKRTCPRCLRVRVAQRHPPQEVELALCRADDVLKVRVHRRLDLRLCD